MTGSAWGVLAFGYVGFGAVLAIVFGEVVESLDMNDKERHGVHVRESTPPPAPRLYALNDSCVIDLEQLVAIVPGGTTPTGAQVELRMIDGSEILCAVSESTRIIAAWREYRGC